MTKTGSTAVKDREKGALEIPTGMIAETCGYLSGVGL
jgi:hypothetical protein